MEMVIQDHGFADCSSNYHYSVWLIGRIFMSRRALRLKKRLAGLTFDLGADSVSRQCHLSSRQYVETALRSGHGNCVPFTEGIPKERWRESCGAIMDGLDRHAETHPDWYTRK